MISNTTPDQQIQLLTSDTTALFERKSPDKSERYRPVAHFNGTVEAVTHALWPNNEGLDNLLSILRAAGESPDVAEPILQNLVEPTTMPHATVALVDIVDVAREETLQTHNLVLAVNNGESIGSPRIAAAVIGQSGNYRIISRGAGDQGLESIAVLETDELAVFGDYYTVTRVLGALRPFLGASVNTLNLHELLPQIKAILQSDIGNSAAAYVHAFQPRLMSRPIKLETENSQGNQESKRTQKPGKNTKSEDKWYTSLHTRILGGAFNKVDSHIKRLYAAANKEHNAFTSRLIAYSIFTGELALSTVIGSIVGNAVLGNYSLETQGNIPQEAATVIANRPKLCRVQAPNPGTEQSPGYVHLRNVKDLEATVVGTATHGLELQYMENDGEWKTLTDGRIVGGDVCIAINEDNDVMPAGAKK